MKKVAIVIVVAVLALPILPKLIPKPLTLERIQAGFEAGAYRVESAQILSSPQLDAIGQLSMRINGAQVEVYQFDDEGKIAKQKEYLKPGPGTVETQAFNLSELAASVGAAKPKNKPVGIQRRGMFLLTVTSEDKALRERVKQTFKSL